MSFISTLLYYRPGQTTPVEPMGLARLVGAIAQSNAIVQDSDATMKLAFGHSRRKPGKLNLERQHWPDISSVLTVVGPNWNIDTRVKSSAVESAVVSVGGEIELAWIEFSLTSDLVGLFSRVGSVENSEDCVLDTLVLMAGSILSGPDGDLRVGDLAVGFTGNGYPFPWTLQNLIERAEADERITTMMQVCRRLFPVYEPNQTSAAQAIRRKLGVYWPYNRVDLPIDWVWGFQGIL